MVTGYRHMLSCHLCRLNLHMYLFAWQKKHHGVQCFNNLLFLQFIKLKIETMRYKLLLVLFSMFMVTKVSAQLTPSTPSTPLTPVTPSTLVIPSTSSSSSDPSALFFKSVQLRDGDSICVTPQYPSNEYCSYEKRIINKYHDQIMSAGILKSFDIQKHGMELRELLESDA